MPNLIEICEQFKKLEQKTFGLLFVDTVKSCTTSASQSCHAALFRLSMHYYKTVSAIASMGTAYNIIEGRTVENDKRQEITNATQSI